MFNFIAWYSLNLVTVRVSLPHPSWFGSCVMAYSFSVHETLLFVISNQVYINIYSSFFYITHYDVSFSCRVNRFATRPAAVRLLDGVRRKLSVHVEASKLRYKRIGPALFSV